MTEQELKECIAEIKNSAVPEQSKKKIVNLLYGRMHENGWIPCREQLPETTGDYLVTYKNGEIGIHKYNFYESIQFWRFYDSNTVPIAWKPLPEAYHADQKGEQVSERK